jgi:hypothetical protein
VSWTCDPVPVDPDFLATQPGGEGHDPVAHYLAHGLERGLNPTPWFVTEWYAWQNPDWNSAHRAPYLHYLEVGAAEGRDPSPFVDVQRYREAMAGSIPAGAIYRSILEGIRSPALGVTDPERLAEDRRRFMAGIRLHAPSTRPVAEPRPALVVLQAGRGSLARRWYRDEGREWDLLVNYYDAAGFVPGLGEYAVFQKGTKFSAMRLLLDRFEELVRTYDHVLFLDDDVETSVGDLNRLFSLCRKHRLDLAQMGLTRDSSSNWPALFAQRGRTGPRPVSAVEIMMPTFSRAALDLIRPTLGRSVSGFGLDLVWGKLVGAMGGQIAVLDEAVAAHRRPVDQSGGAFYGYLRRAGINAKAELWDLVTAYDARRDVVSGAFSDAA